MELNEILNEFKTTQSFSPTKPLNKTSGRNYVYKSPASVRITRKDRQSLLKTTDTREVKAAMEVAFKQIITAATGTSVQQLSINRVNQMRRQIFAKLEKDDERKKNE